MVVNGFFPALNIKQVLNVCSEVTADQNEEYSQETYSNVTDHCDAIIRNLKVCPLNHFLLIYSFLSFTYFSSAAF